MPMVIDGSGTITGLNAGGLPDATVTPADLTQPLTLGTAQATTSGTAIDFTGVPSWVKRITVVLAGVSTNGTSAVQLQLGTSSGVTTSGYSTATWTANTNNAVYSSGFVLKTSSAAAQTLSGQVVFTLLGSNQWVGSGVIGRTDAADSVSLTGGNITLGGTLGRIRLTTVNGSDTFDAGSVNILYE